MSIQREVRQHVDQPHHLSISLDEHSLLHEEGLSVISDQFFFQGRYDESDRVDENEFIDGHVTVGDEQQTISIRFARPHDQSSDNVIVSTAELVSAI